MTKVGLELLGQLKVQWKTFTNMKLMKTDISLTLSPVGGSKDDKTVPLERGSVATCGLKTEGNILPIYWAKAHRLLAKPKPKPNSSRLC